MFRLFLFLLLFSSKLTSAMNWNLFKNPSFSITSCAIAGILGSEFLPRTGLVDNVWPFSMYPSKYAKLEEKNIDKAINKIDDNLIEGKIENNSY